MKQKQKIEIKELLDLSLLNEGQLQCLAEEFEKIISDFYSKKPPQKPPWQNKTKNFIINLVQTLDNQTNVLYNISIVSKW